MRKITKMNFEELSKTMSVIPRLEQISFIAGLGSTTYYSSVFKLTGHLSSLTMSSDYVEASFFQFSDGTFAMYVDSLNTHVYSTVSIYKKSDGHFYFEGKSISAWGHTHIYSDTATTADLNNLIPGVQAYHYKDGTYRPYP